MRTRVPSRRLLYFFEPQTKKVLIDRQDLRDHMGDRKILFNKEAIDAELLLEQYAVVVTIIPLVELAVEWKSLFLVFILLELEKPFDFFLAKRLQFLFEIVQELI